MISRILSFFRGGGATSGTRSRTTGSTTGGGMGAKAGSAVERFLRRR